MAGLKKFDSSLTGSHRGIKTAKKAFLDFQFTCVKLCVMEMKRQPARAIWLAAQLTCSQNPTYFIGSGIVGCDLGPRWLVSVYHQICVPNVLSKRASTPLVRPKVVTGPPGIRILFVTPS